MIRRMGAFSIYREGNDRQAIETAIDILVSKQAAADYFPEGAMTRHNDLMSEMMDGPSFIARQVAKRLKKQKQPGEVVIHPVAIRYAFNGDLAKIRDSDACSIWKRSFRGSRKAICRSSSRIGKIGEAFLSLKEIEFLGATQQGNLYERAEKLIETVLRDWKAIGRSRIRPAARWPA